VIDFNKKIKNFIFNSENKFNLQEQKKRKVASPKKDASPSPQKQTKSVNFDFNAE
jgi:hypothetical protein